MENDIAKQFDEIIEFNDLPFLDAQDIEGELDTEISEDEYTLGEAMELNFILSTVQQQITAAMIDMENDEKTGWLDEIGAILLRELHEVCEQVIDRTYENECDECDDWDGED